MLFSVGHGFIGDSVRAWQEEMALLATEARSGSNPIDHWILSWQADEVPTREQVDEAAEIFLKQLGIEKEEQYQFVYALHKNTRNVHLHIVLNRTHPVTHKVHSVEFAYKAAQRAAALIEHIQGWKPEKGARFAVEVGKEGELQCRPRTEPEPDFKTNPSSKALDFERRTGQKSDARALLEDQVLTNAIKNARSWADLHNRLYELGAWYGRSGGGATLYYKGRFWKASELGRFASLGNLKKKLGEFQPSPFDRPTAAEDTERRPQPLKKVAATEWHRYYAERQQYRERGKQFKATHGACFPDFYEWLQKVASPLVAEQWLHAAPDDDPVPLSTPPPTQPPSRAIPLAAVYEIHRAHIKRTKSVPSTVDESIIDSEIALRMRATGYEQEEVEAAITACSDKYKRMKADSAYYKERIKKYAFSPAGDLTLGQRPELAEKWRRELKNTVKQLASRLTKEEERAQPQRDRER